MYLFLYFLYYFIFRFAFPFSRKGPLQRIKNSEGSRGRRGASPSVTDSPLSINESSLHDDDDFAALSLG